MKSDKFTVKFFPFAPGIPWKVTYGKYIVPSLNAQAWANAISPAKIINIVLDKSKCGLIESYISLSYLELINSIYPNKQINYFGDNKFIKLVKYNGLGKIQPNNFDSKFLSKYPTPIFLDKNKNAYFNVMNNYIYVNSYYGTFGFTDNRSLISQLWRNSTIDNWNDNYLPVFRAYDVQVIDKWIKNYNFYLNKPYVCIFPDNYSGLSVHKEDMLGWSVQQVKAFSSLLKQAGYSTIIFTTNQHNYFGEIVAPIDIDFIFHLLAKTSAVFANEVDFLLISMMINKGCKIFGLKKKNFANLTTNAKFLGRGNVIYKTKDLTPVTAFNNLVKNE